MRGKGKSAGHSQSGTCSGTNILKRCRTNGDVDNVVLIDVDSDSLNNVIILDVPESLKDKLRGSSVLGRDKRCKFRTVICIDDDESSGDDNCGTGTDGSDEFSSDASCSGRFQHASDHTRDSVDAVGNDCQFVPESLPPWKLSKNKRTYSGRASSRNYYGLVPESGLGLSDDSSDCEFMEDSFGTLHKQWEKANMKKKHDIHNSQSDRDDQATTSGLFTGSKQKVEAKNVTDQRKEAQGCSSSSNTSKEEENTSSHKQTDIENSGGISSDPKETSFVDFWLKSNSDIKHGDWIRGESYSASCSGRFPYEFKNECSRSTDNQGIGDNEIGAAPRYILGENLPPEKSGLRQGGNCCLDQLKPVTEESYFFSVPCNEVCIELKTGARVLSAEFMSDHQLVESDGLLSAKERGVMNKFHSCIINEREILKETDEYKRAAEEEWASRQRELQLQAEEAQKLRRLRKREKAESMRLLDMEKRQKQRVEEMREIQKKDEENMNLKEEFRAEVRKELNQLEITCRDMASLLRGLGIPVGGGFQPQAHEVRAAYKRAVLSFHPDRYSGSDIRQLVEVEEKFKLISRMKEKLLPTS